MMKDQKMKWIVDPFVGVEELRFGMSITELTKFIGHYEDKIERSNGYLNYYYHDADQPVLGFRHQILVDVTFGRWTEALFFDGLDYFHTQPPVFLSRVRLHDPEVKRNALGGIRSFLLGLAFDDVELEESDKTITIFARSEIQAYQKVGPFTQA